MTLEDSARRHAIVATGRTTLMISVVLASWTVDVMGRAVPWPIMVPLTIAGAALAVVALPLARVADSLARHVRPLPATNQFHNVVSEIAVAVGEPVEHIVTHDSEPANVAMLPTSQGEVVVATTGALRSLSRYELQALVAAQFAGMGDRWCRLATRAEIGWWALPWLIPIGMTGLIVGNGFFGFASWFVTVGSLALPRWNEQARDFCADVAAVRTTFDPDSLANAMRKLAEQPDAAHEVDLGAWYLPISPFLVLPRRNRSKTTVGGSKGKGRSWTSTDEVRMELALRADRAEAMAAGGDAKEFTGREFRRRWGQLGR